ncbi:MAG: repressor LexA [Ignavibacteria bacterium CG2_30_36_16]|nr:transcriptional repressor LexA [Ignavibacteria bacterium]OIP63921.1 MAG: repressor LexA [Ignavibacteria bacterium CG2_30_36_16]PJB01632.1 MAG: transcriptional repressor LexA [Ignavibacteria bacterium CG_4_9_14_3_um_filter_36_18]
MKKRLTDRQEEILRFIQQFRNENGYPPTLREIGRKFNIVSTFGVKRHLEALEKKGYLNIESNASRGISLQPSDEFPQFERNDNFAKVPIIGRVAAGSPITAIENVEGSLIIDPSFMKSTDNCFALRVKGDSMINAGIFEGDLVVVLPKNEAANGETIVAMLEDEVTVKTFENKNNKVRLIPENDNYKPIDVTGRKEFSIVGKVVGVVRWLN